MKKSKLFLSICAVVLIGVLAFALVACNKDNTPAPVQKVVKGTFAFNFDNVPSRNVSAVPTSLTDISVPEGIVINNSGSSYRIETSNNVYYFDATKAANAAGKQAVIYDCINAQAYGEFASVEDGDVTITVGSPYSGNEIKFISVTNSEGRYAIVDVNGNVVVDYSQTRVYASDISFDSNEYADDEFGTYCLIKYADGKTYMVNVHTFERQEYVSAGTEEHAVGTLYANRTYNETLGYYLASDEVTKTMRFYSSATSATPVSTLALDYGAAQVVGTYPISKQVVYNVSGEVAPDHPECDIVSNNRGYISRYYVFDIASGASKRIFEGYSVSINSILTSNNKSYLSVTAGAISNKSCETDYHYVATLDGTLLVTTPCPISASNLFKFDATHYGQLVSGNLYVFDNCLNLITSVRTSSSIDQTSASFILSEPQASSNSYTEIGFDGKVVGTLTLEKDDTIVDVYYDYVIVQKANGNYVSYKKGVATAYTLFDAAAESAEYTFTYLGKGVSVKNTISSPASLFINAESTTISDMNGFKYQSGSIANYDGVCVVRFVSSSTIMKF